MTATCWRGRPRATSSFSTAGPARCAPCTATTSASCRPISATFKGTYVTGDGARRDEDGYYWITGRVDDVINVSGHRMGTAEVESALVAHPAVAEAAVVGCPHDIKGQGIYCYVTLTMVAAMAAAMVKVTSTAVLTLDVVRVADDGGPATAGWAARALCSAVQEPETLITSSTPAVIQ